MLIYFFFNDTATTEIYTLSLHDALPICQCPGKRQLAHSLRERHDGRERHGRMTTDEDTHAEGLTGAHGDRKSTRLNSSHTVISYAVFCLEKKNDKQSISAHLLT